jgi:hypothetical protein
MVGEDSNTTRASETIGFIVFEGGRYEIDGVAVEAALGPNTVQGFVDNPPYTYAFSTPLPSAPEAVIVSQAGMAGPNGSWAQVLGATDNELYLSVDEDQTGDTERNHVSERVGYVVFAPVDEK